MPVTLAQVRSSTNYQLESDSINIGGGLASSTSYTQESTVGEVATGPSDSASFSLRAGYQQMQVSYISIAVTGDVSLTPNLPGISGGVSNGSTTVTVVTDNGPGYQLTIEAENDPAMQSAVGTIADYVPVGAVPDFNFATTSGQASFSFSPEGVDVASRFLDDGIDTCGTGSTDTSLSCWDGLDTTASIISQSSGPNQPAGATTTVRFRVGIGAGAGVLAGTYVATTTVTALPL